MVLSAPTRSRSWLPSKSLSPWNDVQDRIRLDGLRRTRRTARHERLSTPQIHSLQRGWHGAGGQWHSKQPLIHGLMFLLWR